jgi:hypothetical protein
MNRPDAARLSLNKDLPRSFVLIPDDNCPELVAAGAQFSFVAQQTSYQYANQRIDRLRDAMKQKENLATKRH